MLPIPSPVDIYDSNVPTIFAHTPFASYSFNLPMDNETHYCLSDAVSDTHIYLN